MDTENSSTSCLVRKVDGNGTVESSWTSKSRIENIRAVGSSNDNDARVVFEAIHLDE